MKLTNTTMKSLINNQSNGVTRTITFSFLALVLFTGTSLMAGGREADLPSPQGDSLNVPAGNGISAHVSRLAPEHNWRDGSGHNESARGG
jgi:hypothetical protein